MNKGLLAALALPVLAVQLGLMALALRDLRGPNRSSSVFAAPAAAALGGGEHRDSTQVDAIAEDGGTATRRS